MSAIRSLSARLRDSGEPNAFILRRRAADVLERYETVLDELRGAYDDYYSGDGPERMTRLLNAEKLVRGAQ